MTEVTKQAQPEKIKTEESTIYDVIVLGGGAAGCAASIYAVRSGLKTLMLIGPVPGGQIATAHRVDNYPGFPEGISGLDLALLFEEQAGRAGVVIKRVAAKEVSLEGKIKTISSRRETFHGRSVIIATGATAKKLGVPGEDELRGVGVSYCATCDGSFAKGKDVVVVGGGDTALGDVAYLARLAKTVTIIHRRDRFRAAQKTQDMALQHENVKVIWNSGVVSFKGENGALTAVELTDLLNDETSILPAGHAFVAVGNEPQTAFLQDKIKLTNGFIETNEHRQVDIPGVFAAGDVRLNTTRQVVVAAADGAQAALSAAEYLSLEDVDGHVNGTETATI